jgi:hypothetical protein
VTIGGRFGDTIDAGSDNNLVIGDSGRITAANQDAPQFAGQPISGAGSRRSSSAMAVRTTSRWHRPYYRAWRP